MNSQDTSANGVSTPPEPLFASSWMALYTVIRDQFDSNRDSVADGRVRDPLEAIEEPAET